MRAPDLIIGPTDDPQTHRWHLWLPAFLVRRGWQLALHRWFKSDDDRALHDHRGWSVSVILSGGYWEVFSHVWERPPRAAWRRRFGIYYRDATTPHRVLLVEDGRKVWTLWLRGPNFRQWGFYCPKGWRHWRDYVAERDYSAPGSSSTVGKGCE